MARKEVLILSGSMRSDFYEIDSVVQTINDALNNDVVIKILVGVDFDSKTQQIPLLLKKYSSLGSDLRMFHYPNAVESPEPHFVVVDNIHIRVENSHTKDCSFDSIAAPAPLWHTRRARELAQSFNEYWNTSGSILDEFEP